MFCHWLKALTIIFFLSEIFAQDKDSVTQHCMQLLRRKGSQISCEQCLHCPAGMTPYPPCHDGNIYDADIASHCIMCKDKFFKAENSADACTPCDSFTCRPNYKVLTNCTKSSPDICSLECKDGFYKNNIEDCVPCCKCDEGNIAKKRLCMLEKHCRIVLENCDRKPAKSSTTVHSERRLSSVTATVSDVATVTATAKVLVVSQVVVLSSPTSASAAVTMGIIESSSPAKSLKLNKVDFKTTTAMPGIQSSAAKPDIRPSLSTKNDVRSTVVPTDYMVPKPTEAGMPVWQIITAFFTVLFLVTILFTVVMPHYVKGKCRSISRTLQEITVEYTTDGRDDLMKLSEINANGSSTPDMLAKRETVNLLQADANETAEYASKEDILTNSIACRYCKRENLVEPKDLLLKDLEGTLVWIVDDHLNSDDRKKLFSPFTKAGQSNHRNEKASIRIEKLTQSNPEITFGNFLFMLESGEQINVIFKIHNALHKNYPKVETPEEL